MFPDRGRYSCDNDHMINIVNTYDQYRQYAMSEFDLLYWVPRIGPTFLNFYAFSPILEGRICFEHRWGRVNTSPNR